jgi:hypothetical protein
MEQNMATSTLGATNAVGSAARPAADARWLDIDAASFQSHFDRKPFLIGHRLCGHPLFELPRLIELARRLPEGSSEYNAGDVPVHLDPSKTPRNGLSVEETIRRIEECRSWLVLKNVEQDLEYRALLEECLTQVRSHSEPLFPGMMNQEAFIFITSPNSVTPYHVDPEHNFLLQVRGSKTVHLFDGRDRTILSEEELENYYGGAHRNLAYRPEVEAKAMVFELTPGLGLHFPVTFPHWVRNGDGVSVSFSITFYTPDLDRRRAVHGLNAWLRRRGVSPRPFGRSSWRDGAKFFLYRAWRRARRLLGRPIS